MTILKVDHSDNPFPTPPEILLSPEIETLQYGDAVEKFTAIFPPAKANTAFAVLHGYYQLYPPPEDKVDFEAAEGYASLGWETETHFCQLYHQRYTDDYSVNTINIE